MIKSNPKWKHVGTYVDDGFSGRRIPSTAPPSSS